MADSPVVCLTLSNSWNEAVSYFYSSYSVRDYGLYFREDLILSREGDQLGRFIDLQAMRLESIYISAFTARVLFVFTETVQVPVSLVGFKVEEGASLPVYTFELSIAGSEDRIFLHEAVGQQPLLSTSHVSVMLDMSLFKGQFEMLVANVLLKRNFMLQ